MGARRSEARRSVNTDKLKRYAALKREAKSAVAKGEILKAEAAVLEEELLEEFAEEGVQSLTVEGSTIYLNRTLRAWKAPGATNEDLYQAAMANPETQFLGQNTVNNQTLTRYMKDLEEAAAETPPELERVVQTAEVFKLGVRRA